MYTGEMVRVYTSEEIRQVEDELISRNNETKQEGYFTPVKSSIKLIRGKRLSEKKKIRKGNNEKIF